MSINEHTRLCRFGGWLTGIKGRLSVGHGWVCVQHVVQFYESAL